MPRLPATRPHYAFRPTGSDAPLGDLLGGLEVARGAPRTGIVGHHRLAIARRLGDPDVAGDDRLEHLVAEVVPDVLLDGVGQPGTPVVHGQQDRGDVERRVQVLAYQVDVVDQLVEPFQRVVLALDRDQHLLRGHERVDRQQAERRRAVDEDVVELARVARRSPGPAATPGPPRRPARSPRRRGRWWRGRTTGSGCPRPPGPPRPAARCRSGSRRRPGRRCGAGRSARSRRCPAGRGRPRAPGCRAGRAPPRG